MLKNIFSPVFYHQNAGKCRKNVLKSQATLSLYLQCSLPSALNSPVSSPTFSGFSSR